MSAYTKLGWVDGTSFTTPTTPGDPEVNASGLNHMDQGIFDASWPAGTATRFVAGSGVGLSGSDSNDGLSPAKAFATIQAAYDDLPDWSGQNQGGGTLVLLPGLHDVGTGFLGTGLNKHAVVTSLTGYKPPFTAAARGGDLPLSYPVIHTTQNATTLMQLGYTGGTNQNGWVFSGLAFDMSNTLTIYGIDGRDVNFGLVQYCTFEGGTDSGERYAIRTRVVNGTDASWWRVRNNWARYVGMFRGGDGGADNGNQHVISENSIFPGANSSGIVFDHADRCVTFANNIEGSSTAAINLLSADRCLILGDAGEGAFTFFVAQDSACNANIILPMGSTSETYRVQPGSATNPSRFLAYQNPDLNNKTTDYTLVFADMGTILRMNSASPQNLTVPHSTSVRFPQGATIRVNQRGAGQTTVVAGGSVTVNSRIGLKLAGQYAAATLEHMGNDEWLLYGDLTA